MCFLFVTNQYALITNIVFKVIDTNKRRDNISRFGNNIMLPQIDFPEATEADMTNKVVIMSHEK